MRKGRISEELIIIILKEEETGAKLVDLPPEQTFHRSKAKDEG